MLFIYIYCKQSNTFLFYNYFNSRTRTCAFHNSDTAATTITLCFTIILKHCTCLFYRCSKAISTRVCVCVYYDFKQLHMSFFYCFNTVDIVFISVSAAELNCYFIITQSIWTCCYHSVFKHTHSFVYLHFINTETVKQTTQLNMLLLSLVQRIAHAVFTLVSNHTQPNMLLLLHLFKAHGYALLPLCLNIESVLLRIIKQFDCVFCNLFQTNAKCYVDGGLRHARFVGFIAAIEVHMCMSIVFTNSYVF